MSSVHTPPDCSPSNLDFSALAASLQEAAQALLAMSPTHMPIMSKDAMFSPPVRKDAGETRSFYFPSGAVRLEKELLQKYRANDFQGLLAEAHTLLSGLVKVMMSTHPDARMRGHVVSSLGASLEQVVALLVRMRNVYDKVERRPA